MTVLGKVELEPKVIKPTNKEALKASEPKEEEALKNRNSCKEGRSTY